jgi:hypothetical protein
MSRTKFAAAAVAVAFAGLSLAGCKPLGPATTPAPTTTTQAPTGPASTFKDGTYEVGVDIKAGKYKTPGLGDGKSCYISENTGSGSDAQIDQNDFFTGPGIVTVAADKVVKASGGCTWTLETPAS